MAEEEEAASPHRVVQNTGSEQTWTDGEQQKIAAILEACSCQDIDRLKELAVSKDGFLVDSLRRQAWPILLGSAPPHDGIDCDEEETISTSPSEKATSTDVADSGTLDSQIPWQELPKHRDEEQVSLDVNRSFVYYPNGQSDAQMKVKKNDLSCLITETLRRYPYLCYFQGYHDICQVFLLVLPPKLRTTAVAHLSALRIRDFMLPNLQPAISQLRLIPDILNLVDPKLCRHLSETEPFFALSGTLTMYAHDIQSYSSIARLFDALLAREQIFSVYMFAQIVLNRRAELFETPASEPEMLHSILSKLPQPLDLDKLINDTDALFKEHPPEHLRSWHGISNASVMKTARDVKVCAKQTLEDGQRFFEQQSKELLWADRRKKMARVIRSYKPPTRTIAISLLVGIIAATLGLTQPWAYLFNAWAWLRR